MGQISNAFGQMIQAQHQELLNNRDGFLAKFGAPSYASELIVDSVISGVVSQLERVAANPQLYQLEIEQIGARNFPSYASLAVSGVKQSFTGLGGQAAAQPGGTGGGSQSGRTPGRR